MKKEEFLLGVCIYALVILGGFTGPLVEKLKKLNWDKPVEATLEPLIQASAQSGAAGSQALRRAPAGGLGVHAPMAQDENLNQRVPPEAAPESGPGSAPSARQLFGKKPFSKSVVPHPTRKIPKEKNPPRDERR